MRRLPTVSLLAVLVLVAGAFGAGPAFGSHPGGVHTLRTWDPGIGELPEGIAVDKRGRIYVSMPFIGELRRIDPDGSEHLVANLPFGDFGPLGLAVDAPGNVYAGVVTFDAATHGVYRVTPAGSAARLPGTQAVAFPNGVAFGDRGTLYVSDSIGGAVWRIPRGGAAEPWAQHALLEGDGSAPPPFPIGANGITYRNGVVYVTNTEKASIVTIPVRADGSAGTPAILAQGGLLGGADGIALDVHGNAYVPVIAQSTVVWVARDGSSMHVVADGSDGLDFASSVAFGTGRGERQTLFAVNFSIGPLFGSVRTHGPALLAIDAGVPGLPQP